MHQKAYGLQYKCFLTWPLDRLGTELLYTVHLSLGGLQAAVSNTNTSSQSTAPAKKSAPQALSSVGAKLDHALQASVAASSSVSEVAQTQHKQSAAGKRRRLLVAPSIKPTKLARLPQRAAEDASKQNLISFACDQPSASEPVGTFVSAIPTAPSKAQYTTQAADQTSAPGTATSAAENDKQLSDRYSSWKPAGSETSLHACTKSYSPADMHIPKGHSNNSAKPVPQRLQSGNAALTASAKGISALPSQYAAPALDSVSQKIAAQTPPQLSRIEQHSCIPNSAYQQSASICNVDSTPGALNAQNSRAAKACPEACHAPRAVSTHDGVTRGKQTGVGHLLSVQRLPAVLTTNLPSAEDLGMDIQLPTASAMIGKHTALHTLFVNTSKGCVLEDLCCMATTFHFCG